MTQTSQPKLSKDVFAAQMKTLKYFFIKWEFDPNDKVALKVWYRFCQRYTDEQFRLICEWYMDNVEFPPRDPKELGECYRKVFRAQFPSRGEMAGMVTDWLRKYSIYQYSEAMADCPPFIANIRISNYAWQDLQNYPAKKEWLLDSYERLVGKTVEERCLAFEEGKTGLPVSDEGKVIPYSTEKDRRRREVRQLCEDFTIKRG